MALLSSTILLISQSARGVQPTGAIASPDIPVSHHDRVYTADQFSNTISVTDPVDNKLLGVIRLGYPLPGNLSPLYHGNCWSTERASHLIITLSNLNCVCQLGTSI